MLPGQTCVAEDPGNTEVPQLDSRTRVPVLRLTRWAVLTDGAWKASSAGAGGHPELPAQASVRPVLHGAPRGGRLLTGWTRCARPRRSSGPHRLPLLAPRCCRRPGTSSAVRTRSQDASTTSSMSSVTIQRDRSATARNSGKWAFTQT